MYDELKRNAADWKSTRAHSEALDALPPLQAQLDFVEKILLKQDFVFYRPLFKSVVVEIPGESSGVPLKTGVLKKRKKI